MDWTTKYTDRIACPEEAVRKIKSGNRVFLTGNCSVPHRLLNALVDYAPNLTDVEICQSLTVAGSEYVSPEMDGHLRVNSLFISGNVRKAVQEGRADFTPVLLSELPLLFKRGVLEVDVALVHLSPPDEHGFCTFGVEGGLSKTAAESSRMIIAEINEQMPRMLGDTLIHISKIDTIVPVNCPLSEYPMCSEAPSPVIDKIAMIIADRIPDGATMQMGIGEIPDAVLKHLYHKKDLGVHTELFSDGIIGLVESGVINGSKKTIHNGKITAGFILGTNKLYRWVHDNALIEIHRTEYVNNPFVIAKNKNMVAINSAIEIDLTGQICADSIGTRFYSGVGGQMDFIYGSSLADGGLPIIALPSTSTLRDGSVFSRIVPTLKPGAGVVTTRNHAHYIVTEYGMIDLYGKSIRQRAQQLISIAHPDFRKGLEREAKALNYI